ncbi:helix-turn-helix transcriptional regulator [Lelliottia sp.]|uniref:helix-turn-helix domain-containing protein n=1 Tax=Lelliottia sp. TaxID=1898429 RepID=UPI00389042B5
MSSLHTFLSEDYFFMLGLKKLFSSHPFGSDYFIVDVETTSRSQVEQCSFLNKKVYAFISNDFDYYALCHLENVIFIDRRSEMSEVLYCLSINHTHFNYRVKSKLSERENDVLTCLQEGLDTREIGLRLGVNIKNIYASRARLMNKMHVGNRIYLYRNIVRQ